MANNLEIFNAHQEDTRRRVDTLAKAVILISGGALTLSIGVFIRSDAPKISAHLWRILYSSWCALFYSIAAFVLVMVAMILGSYVLGERWRASIHGQVADVTSWPGWSEIPQWFFGVTGLIAFLYGLWALAYVAIGVVKGNV